MGERGRVPQPVEIVKQKGYYKPSKHQDQILDSKGEIKFVHNFLPSPPERLSEYAQNVWTSQLVQAQEIYGYISFLDLKVFEEYCYVCGEMEYLKENTKERYYTDEKGVRRVDPMYMELNKIRKDFIRLTQEFGFSPSARTRVSLIQKPDIKEDEFDGGL